MAFKVLGIRRTGYEMPFVEFSEPKFVVVKGLPRRNGKVNRARSHFVEKTSA